MILIDEEAEGTCIEMLETLRAYPQDARCIYFSLMGITAPVGLKEKIIASATQHIASMETKMFLFDDTDICIIAPIIVSKDARKFILEIAEFTHWPASTEWVGFYDVMPQLHKLIYALAQKLEKRHKAEEEKRKRAEELKHKHKRQTILNGGAHATAEEINILRKHRSTPEFMIIEDDAFSRRLVENVLQKKYALTSLAEAGTALDTYARLAPNIVFMDINLPDVTGHELLEKILILDPEAYVIMLSGNADQGNITQAMSKGAKGFVAKPFSKEKLFQYIERCPSITHALAH